MTPASMHLLGDLMLLVGAGFMLLGSLGLMRMPDVYSRVQAGTKAVTLGSLALLLGVGLYHPDWWAKLLLIALFILLTSPLGGSTLIRAARISGLEPWRIPEDRRTEESQ
jgi:multicomponent Na+:H+ antiporter subunit G